MSLETLIYLKENLL